jgi:TetR/AcrR family transcriptional repressor of nem operon
MLKNTTREKILKRCFEALEVVGFESLRADKEVLNLNISKGALYHYFPTKLDIGYAMVDEIIKPMYEKKWSGLIDRTEGISATIYQIIESEKQEATEKKILRGDVLYNLMLEMSGVDLKFRQKLEDVLELQVKILQKSLLSGKSSNEIKAGVDSRSMAYLLIGQLHGCYAIAKTRASKDVFVSMVNGLQKQLIDVLYVNDPSRVVSVA